MDPSVGNCAKLPGRVRERGWSSRVCHLAEEQGMLWGSFSLGTHILLEEMIAIDRDINLEDDGGGGGGGGGESLWSYGDLVCRQRTIGLRFLRIYRDDLDMIIEKLALAQQVWWKILHDHFVFQLNAEGHVKGKKICTFHVFALFGQSCTMTGCG